MRTASLAIARAVAAALSVAAGGAAAAPELEEIVVTAQKRAQNLQEVGIAISAFSGEELRELGVRSLREVPNFTPNVTLFDEYGTGQPTWVIRGVGLSDFSANNTPTAAIYIDDVYMTSNVMGGVGLFDLARIEVLKGPQGALYGRNTSGGAVLVVSERPDTEAASGYADISYGRWDDVIAEGAANLPLGERAALRVSGRWNQSDGGWQESIDSGGEHGEKDVWAARALLLVDIGARTEMLVNVHGGADQSETVMGRGIGLYDPLTGGFCAPLLAGRLDDANCATNATFYDPAFRFPSVQSDDGRRTLSDPFNRLDNESVGGSLRVTHEFDAATLTVISAFESFDYSLDFDYDGSNGEFGHQRARSDISTYSHEVRLASDSDGPLNWLVGLEVAEDELDENRFFLLRDDLFLAPLLGGKRANLRYDQTTESVAAYVQTEWQFAAQWRLNAGLRYTDESKDYEDGSFTLYSGGVAVPAYSGLESDTDLQIWSGKIGLDWTPSDCALIYASVSKGFKSGGFFGGFPTEGQDSIEPYDEETVIAWELGFKTQWLDDSVRLNGAVFYYDYTDAQGYLTVTGAGGTVLSRLGNQGDAEHKGAELDLLWQATERLGFQAAVSWLDAEITDSDETSISWLGTEEPLEGTKRAYAPDYSYSLIGRYEMPIGTLALAAQLDYSWRDDLGASGLSVIERTMNRELEAYGLLGARVSLASADSGWELALWGKNLADEDYYVTVTTDDLASWMKLPGEPLSYGLDLRYQW